jgi:hypothetical protein
MLLPFPQQHGIINSYKKVSLMMSIHYYYSSKGLFTLILMRICVTEYLQTYAKSGTKRFIWMRYIVCHH